MSNLFKTFILIIAASLLVGLSSCGADSGKENRPASLMEITEIKPGSRDIPYKFDVDYQYRYMAEGVNIGYAIFRIAKLDGGGFEIKSGINIKDDKFKMSMKGEGILTLDKYWNPVKYSREIDAVYSEEEDDLNGVYKVDVTFNDQSALLEFLEPSDEEPEKIALQIPDNVFVFDNNMIGLMAYICSQPVYKSGRRETMKIVGVSQQAIIDLQLTAKMKHEMKFQGRDVIAYNIDMKANEQTFGHYFVLPNGSLIRAVEEGERLVIEPEYESQQAE